MVYSGAFFPTRIGRQLEARMMLPRLSQVGRAAVFAPLDQFSRPELVARSLGDAIALGLLPDAEQLPPEADLAERFRVSPTTIRHALSLLRHRGLVQTRRGRHGGSFVTAPSDPARRVLEVRLQEASAADIRDLGDHYAAIGAKAAALAAERADAEDVARIRRAADAVSRASNARERRRSEGIFHIEVAAAAQSVRLTREEIALQREIAPLIWLPTKDEPAVSEVVAEHEAIAAAIADEKPAEASLICEQHVHDAVQSVLRLQRELKQGAQTRATP
ncbi:MAG TPA: FCD domain-containing protein [Segeticoccus sp.]|nr:FCD domain-containing protein [Segeticoccus sp.]